MEREYSKQQLMKDMGISRKRMLMEFLMEVDARKRSTSKHLNGLEPMPGAVPYWTIQDSYAEIIREMIPWLIRGLIRSLRSPRS